MGTVTSEIRVVCKSDVCALWTAMTDTERMNRAVGMKPIELVPLSGDNAARYLVQTRLNGFQLEYEERPYEWEYLRFFRIYRKMRNGPVRALDMDYAFQAAPDGATEVRVRITLEPRLAILGPFVRLNSTFSLKRFAREIKKLDGELAGRGCAELAAAQRSEADAIALERAARALGDSGVAPALVTRLVEHVRNGADFDLSRMRPYALAAQWQLPRREVLAGCLSAVKAGLLELHWDVVCPSCRTASASATSLSALDTHGACQLCDIRFGLDVEEAVEATFTPQAAIRRVDDGPYCIGGPARTPHVLCQAVLPAGGEARLRAPLESGAYRVFVRGGRQLRLDVEADAPAELALEDGAAEWPGRARLAPGGVVVVRHPGSDERHVKLERQAWVQDGATARDVVALPLFRREFSAEVLRPDVTLKVSRVALLFSDLTDSTRLYASAGDAAAFRLVHDHFDVVLALIESHGGAVVKTIGDAVMAAFSDELDALRAARAILEAFATFRAQGPLRAQTDIKLGVYAGPCYVVTANKALDYFGQTVNIAARLQAQAHSGELVVEARLADEAIERGLLAAGDVVERYPAALKGVDGALAAARIRRAG